MYFNLPVPSLPHQVESNEKFAELLLNDYWSHGYVKIEVIDGERFHEDIFLGEVNLYY